ncbi:MAG: hypothetical protein PUP92_40565, partial [Rhizonema sp. PD38]|nr:hypothetical protein [Rhizonema sp. PD38]
MCFLAIALTATGFHTLPRQSHQREPVLKTGFPSQASGVGEPPSGDARSPLASPLGRRLANAS